MGKYKLRIPEADIKIKVKPAKLIRGLDGETPYIGVNGNWWIGDIDTGVPALKRELPEGGTEGQVLTKNSELDGDVSWKNLPRGGPELFRMGVDEEGNLWMYTYGENEQPVLEYDSETGNLYYVMEV